MRGHYGQHGPKHISAATELIGPTNLQNEALETKAIPVANTTPEIVVEREQEMLTLKEELAA